MLCLQHDLMRDDIRREYQQLCSGGTKLCPLTTLLFGDDLSKSARDSKQFSGLGFQQNSRNINRRRSGFYMKSKSKKGMNWSKKRQRNN